MFRFLRSKVHGGEKRMLGRRVLTFESLEIRGMLSAGPSGVLADLTQITARPALVGPYQPSQVGLAYSFNQVKGISSLAGTGQTIAIVDAYNHPSLAHDLAVFDAQWGLPAPPSFLKVSQTGSTRSLPVVDSGWAMETALDVEWAHAMAPGARILVVEANSATLGDLMSAVNYARNYPGVSVVSMSWGTDEFSGETSFDHFFTTPAGHAGVSFVAATGDSGAPGLWPAFSPNVVATGGTSLTLNSDGTISSETGWDGSGGGVSLFEPKPAYQKAVQTGAFRATPDVAFNADPNTGYLVYDSVAYSGQSGWWQIGGTSAAAPQWAALLAVANQVRAVGKLGPLQQTPASIYAVYAASPSHFHDITVGSNGLAAGPGFDLVTGLGSPNASQIIGDLTGLGASATRAAAKTSSATGSSWLRGLLGSADVPATAGMSSHADAMAIVQEPFADFAQAAPAILTATGTASATLPRPELGRLIPVRIEALRNIASDTAMESASGGVFHLGSSAAGHHTGSILSLDSAGGKAPSLSPDRDRMETLGGPTWDETPDEARRSLEESLLAESTADETGRADAHIRWAVDAQVTESDKGGVAGLVSQAVDRVMSIDGETVDPLATAFVVGVFVGRILAIEPQTGSDRRHTLRRVTAGTGS